MRNAEIGALAVSSAHGQGNMIYYGSINVKTSDVTRALVILHRKGNNGLDVSRGRTGGSAISCNQGAC